MLVSKNAFGLDSYIVFEATKLSILYSSFTSRNYSNPVLFDKDCHLLSENSSKMNLKETSTYSLLLDGEIDGHSRRPKTPKSHRAIIFNLIICIFFVVSVGLNISFFMKSDSSAEEAAVPESRWGILCFTV